MTPYKCSLCLAGVHCEGDSNNAECECVACQDMDERHDKGDL
jgi:hypothetical protein